MILRDLYKRVERDITERIDDLQHAMNSGSYIGHPERYAKAVGQYEGFTQSLAVIKEIFSKYEESDEDE